MTGMHSITTQLYSCLVIWLVTLSLLMTGCASAPPAPQKRPTAKTKTPPPDTQADQAQAAQQHAQQLEQAMDRHSPADPADQPADHGAIQWIETTPPTATQPANTPSSAESTPTAASDPHGQPAHPMTQAAATGADGSAAGSSPTRAQLIEQLFHDIRHSASPAMEKAMAAAALSLVDPSRPLVDADLTELTAPQRERIRHYHQLITALGKQAVLDDKPVDRAALIEQLDRLLGPRPIRIRQVKLCRRVRGYGVYDAFDSHSFLAGHEQPMIVYVELDDYQSQQAPHGQYLVRLTQEVLLYNEVDGLAVWSQPRVDIMDESRNRRQDFFLVQLIRLPAKLGVGKYLLKVRVKDVTGGSMDEISLPISLVADQDLIVPDQPAPPKPEPNKPSQEEPEK